MDLKMLLGPFSTRIQSLQGEKGRFAALFALTSELRTNKNLEQKMSKIILTTIELEPSTSIKNEKNILTTTGIEPLTSIK